MNNQFDTFVSFLAFWRPSWNSPLPATFLTLKMISMDSLNPKTQVKPSTLSLKDRSRWSYIGYMDAAAKLDSILNYTFLPHIWNVYPSFLKSPMGPLQGSRVKIRGHHCTRHPAQQQDYQQPLTAVTARTSDVIVCIINHFNTNTTQHILDLGPPIPSPDGHQATRFLHLYQQLATH